MTEDEVPVQLTTEEEVKQLSIINSRNLFQLLITRPMKDLGKKRNLVDRDSHLGTEGLVEYRSFKDPNFELHRIRLESSVQVAQTINNATVQTKWCRKVNSSAQTAPVSLLPEYRQSIQEQDDFLQFAHKVAERINPVLDSNISSDVFKDQLLELEACDDSLVKSFSISQLKESLSLKDARFNNLVLCIDWMPGKDDTVAISFSSSQSFDSYIKKSAFGKVEFVFIWNFNAILHPECVLESPSVVTVVKFCPWNPKIVVGGCENGQVIMWDLSDQNTKVDAALRTSYSTEDSFSVYYHPKFSSMLLGPNLQPTKSHTQPVKDLQWLPQNQRITRIGEIESCESSSQFLTTSLDGHLVAWDTNIDPNVVHANVECNLPGASLKNEWSPAFSINIFKNTKESIYMPTSFFALIKDGPKINGECRMVTDYGEAVAFNWTTGPDRSVIGRQNPHISVSTQLLYHSATAFVGSPFINGLFLACDRYCALLVDMSSGICELFRSSARNHAITCALFSPTRPSVFLLGKENGDVEIWSLLDKSHECLFSQSVASSKVASLYIGTGKKGKQVLCVGCGDGSLMVYKTPSFMSAPVPKEHELVKTFVEQQRKFAEQTNDRFKLRATAGKRTETTTTSEKLDTEKKTEEEEDDHDKVDLELLQFEKEYERISKEFETLEREQAQLDN